MADNKAPLLDEKMVTWLEELFPDTLPESPIPHDEIMVKIGQQYVIRKLRSELKHQQNTHESRKVQGLIQR
jgi:hypothetical protein